VGAALGGNVKCAAVEGRIVQVRRLGVRSGLVDLDEVARNRLRILGVSFRRRRR
jgi:NADPH2:quinone reductase